MNSFVNTLLSVMLGWIRMLISNIWTVLSSEDGGALFQFLSTYWLAIVIMLCAAGVLVDLIVYFFRWRPDYVWATRWRKLKRGNRQSESELSPTEEPVTQPEPIPEQAVFTHTYAPAMQFSPTWQPAEAQDASSYTADDVDFWESEEELDLDWTVSEEVPSFGAPQSEPLTYFRDVQAGFAPAVPPEQLYAPAAQQQAWPVSESVHPGLDDETFRQNLGLSENTEPEAIPVVRAPSFQPFTVTRAAEETVPPSALQRFAQKAREFIAMDENEKTIYDLQSNVDVSKAFHKPVYPQSFDHTEE